MKEQNTGTVLTKKRKEAYHFFFQKDKITLKLHCTVDLMVENCPISYSVQCYHVILDFKAYNLLSLLLILFKCLEDDFRMGISALKFLDPLN